MDPLDTFKGYKNYDVSNKSNINNMHSGNWFIVKYYLCEIHIYIFIFTKDIFPRISKNSNIESFIHMC